MRKRLAIISTHPIQYNAPLFRLISERGVVEVKVYYTWGQSENEVYDERFLVQRKWDVSLTSGYQCEFLKNVSWKPDSNRFMGVINPGLIKKLRKEKFDGILVYRWSLLSHLCILQFFGRKTKLFFRGDSHLNVQRSAIGQLLRSLFMRFVYRNVSTAFYVGSHNKNYYLKYGLSEKKLIFSPHAVDNLFFQSDADKWELRARNQRAQLGIPETAIVFLYAGKFYNVKHLDFLINVFKRLQGNHYRLVLVGGGVQESYLKNIAETDTRILFDSFHNQSDMPWVYRIGDVFVLPSKSETWGLSVNEAMACGRPVVVSSNCGCVPELVLQGETGFVFESGNADDLFSKMTEIGKKEVIMRMSKSVLHHIDKFSLENVAISIEQRVYSDLLT